MSPASLGVTIKGEQWFIAKDMCNALDLTHTGEAVRPLDGCDGLPGTRPPRVHPSRTFPSDTKSV